MEINLFPVLCDRGPTGRRFVEVPWLHIVIGSSLWRRTMGISFACNPERGPFPQGSVGYRWWWVWTWVTYEFVLDHGRLWWLHALSPIDIFWRPNRGYSRLWTGREREIRAYMWRLPWTRERRIHNV